jgi:hypothetical protein
MESGKIEDGGMAEWLKAAVLKTVNGVTRSGVRIPLPPPDIEIALRGLSLFTPLNPARGARLPCVTATCPHGAGDHIRVA